MTYLSFLMMKAWFSWKLLGDIWRQMWRSFSNRRCNSRYKSKCARTWRL